MIVPICPSACQTWAQVSPGVGRTVDPVAFPDVAADVGLARADPDDVGVGRRHRDRADRRYRLLVEDRLPLQAAVDRFPHAAGCGRSPVDARVAGNAGHARHAASGSRADQAVLEVGVRSLQCIVFRFAGDRRGRGEHQERGSDERQPQDFGARCGFHRLLRQELEERCSILARRLSGNAVCPGPVRSTIVRPRTAQLTRPFGSSRQPPESNAMRNVVRSTDSNRSRLMVGLFVLAWAGLLACTAPAPEPEADAAPIVSAEAAALHEAARDGNLAEVRRWVEQEKVPVDAGDRYDATALMMASDRGHVEVVQYLIDAGADVNHREVFFNTSAFDLAVWREKIDVGRVLLAAGSDQREDALGLAVAERPAGPGAGRDRGRTAQRVGGRGTARPRRPAADDSSAAGERGDASRPRPAGLLARATGTFRGSFRIVGRERPARRRASRSVRPTQACASPSTTRRRRTSWRRANGSFVPATANWRSRSGVAWARSNR